MGICDDAGACRAWRQAKKFLHRYPVSRVLARPIHCVKPPPPPINLMLLSYHLYAMCSHGARPHNLARYTVHCQPSNYATELAAGLWAGEIAAVESVESMCVLVVIRPRGADSSVVVQVSQ